MTKIQWTDEVWNPVTGCAKVSEGCRNCYAESVAHRFWGERKFTDVQCHEDRLDVPLHWKKPRKLFVNSMSDLFHEDVPDKFIAAVFGVMGACQQHTFQILTKRPGRMREWFRWVESKRGELTVALVKQGGAWPKVDEYSAESVLCVYCARKTLEPLSKPAWAPWPLPNVWLGLSVEDQATADERIPILLDTPAAVTFLSCEPLLGEIDIRRWLGGLRVHRTSGSVGRITHSKPRGIDWVICGGESGPGARPCDVAWIRSIRDQCQAAGVPVFVKQLGARPIYRTSFAGADELRSNGRRLKDKKGGDPSEWPADLRVREWPL